MTTTQVIEALERADGDALTAARPFDLDIGPAIEAVLDDLGERGRHLATCVLREVGGEASAKTLLTMTGDASESIAIAAADALLTLDTKALPDASLIVHTAAVRLSPNVRERLYRLIGQLGDRTVLDRLRSISDQERVPSARRKLELAAARLGGQPERRALIEQVEKAGQAEAREVFEEVVLSNDRGALRAMLPWLDDRRVALVVGSHDRTFEIGMSDLAVIAADRLGLDFERASPLPLRPVPPALVPLARAAMQAIPVVPVANHHHERPQHAVASPVPPPIRPAPLPVPPLVQPAIRQQVTMPLKMPGESNQTMELPPDLLLHAAATPFPERNPARTPDLAARAVAPAAPKGPPTELDYERYSWACACFAVHPERKEQTLRQINVPDDRAWASIHVKWQDWLGADRARMSQWLQYVQRLRQELKQG